jgi:7-cyano-7-deazaguanine synthase in queuosine biosynthesis
MVTKSEGFMILLFSGGFDSTLLSLRYLEDLDVLLHLRYDHPSKDQELAASMRIYSHLKNIKPVLRFEIIDLPINADNMKIGTGKSGARYVPNRNAIFLSMAANFAAVHGIKKIIYGASPNDQEDYFDCTPAFIEGISTALQITIEAPLLGEGFVAPPAYVSKATAKRILSMVWSCYESSGGDPCGVCNSCMQDRPVLY